MPAATKRKELFLSHSHRDRVFVVKLTQFLQKQRIHYWYSETAIRGAKQWHDEIGKSLRRCNWLVIVLSPHSVKSKWVKHELLFALNDKRYNERIVPLLLKSCKHEKLSWTLSSFEFVDFSKTFAAGCKDLLKSLR
jgi:hypothetical protein